MHQINSSCAHSHSSNSRSFCLRPRAVGHLNFFTTQGFCLPLGQPQNMWFPCGFALVRNESQNMMLFPYSFHHLLTKRPSNEVNLLLSMVWDDQFLESLITGIVWCLNTLWEKCLCQLFSTDDFGCRIKSNKYRLSTALKYMYNVLFDFLFLL